MTVLAIGSISATQGIPPNQSGDDYQAQISNLEKQKELLQKKIRLVNQDDSVSMTDKQQEIALYHTQIQAIDTQIQQLEQKLAEKDSKQQDSGAASTGGKNAGGVNIEV